MSKAKLPEDIVEKIKKLEQKYAAMGQDMRSYLDGLLYADYLTYWDYVHLDTLLSLQNPKTSFRDEMIFIVYHQVTELFFRLILHAMEQIADTHRIRVPEYVTQLRRINNYFEILVNSYDVMVKGMNQEEFLKFRMSLLPASGFQSVQFRMIEICATNLDNLVALSKRGQLTAETSLEEKYQILYWKEGATELATGKKTLTLRQFDLKYRAELLDLAEEYATKNLWVRYNAFTPEEKENEELITELRRLDYMANVAWPLSHYRAAVRYLQKDPADIAATGGTNWQKYLPPKYQKIIFFPNLWEDVEISDWGTKKV